MNERNDSYPLNTALRAPKRWIGAGFRYRIALSPAPTRSVDLVTCSVTCSMLGAIRSVLSSSCSGVITGVDLSNWQHPAGSTIEYSRARGAGVSFALIFKDKLGAENPYFLADHSGFRSVGVVTGSYVSCGQNYRSRRRRRTSAVSANTAPCGPTSSDRGFSPAALVAWWSELVSKRRKPISAPTAFLGNVFTAT